MDDARSPDPSVSGPLSPDAARAHLDRGAALLATGEFSQAAVHFNRVIGFDDPEVTAAGLLGLGEARYRMDDEEGAVASWTAVTRLPETTSTYPAWRNVAAARVRDADLTGAIAAYREADRRAPAADKPEIANRLGWLSKETGDTGASRRYFSKGRGDGPLIPMATVILAATVIVSMTVFLSSEGQALQEFLWLDKAGVAAGEYWRLWTVTLVHGDLLHLFFNMYALFLAGPVVERWYGSIKFVMFYLLCAAAGSVASFVFGGDDPSVGASGAIFGLFGILLATGRVHRPVDRASRGLIQQLGVLILVNIMFGLASGGRIDNAAHLGGLIAGLWLGAWLRPSEVATMSAGWTVPDRASGAAAWAGGPAANPTRQGTARLLMALVLAAVVVVLVVGVAFGTAVRSDGPGRQTADAIRFVSSVGA
ncbi:MAG: rhomboid family intramembrane serine protease [Candidatus Limnocylindrales bacterium]